MNMKIYISSSWKNRERVRILANKIREHLQFEVYDFTDSNCRKTPEIPPERFPDNFDPVKHIYKNYIRSVIEWQQAVEENKQAIINCDLVVLMLPCGNDAHADAYFGLGLGKKLVVCGQPRKNERSTTHLWADNILDFDFEVIDYLLEIKYASGE